MSKARQTPHRSKRETQEIRAAEVRLYRGQNQKLRKELRRLRRELEKFTETWEENNEPQPESDPALPPLDLANAASVGIGCIACGGDSVARVKIGSKTIIACKDCGERCVEKDPQL